MRLRNAAIACAGLLMPGVGSARDVVEVNLTPTVREYCHIVRFPTSWGNTRLLSTEGGPPKWGGDCDAGANYEFRVSGLLGTKFLVRCVSLSYYYSTNLYTVDLSDAKAVAQPASEEGWNAATVIARHKGPTDVLKKYIDALGFQFKQSGGKDKGWDLSPDRSLLVVQSWSGKLGPAGSDVPGDFSLHFGRTRGKLFFDVYNTDTGKKMITITASFVTIYPEEVFAHTGWVTERYFVVPLSERRERCLVCEFGRR